MTEPRTLALAAGYCRILATVERAHLLGDDEAVRRLLAGVDPIDCRIVAEDLEAMSRREPGQLGFHPESLRV